MGILWVGTFSGGLHKFDRETHEFFPYTHNPENLKSLSHNRITAIYEDHSGTLWIGTVAGLNRFERQQNKISHWVNEPEDLQSLSHNHIRAIFEDRTGTLWIGTHGGGLNKFDREKEIFTSYGEKDGLPNDVIYGILEDDRGDLWLSTNKGLSRFNPRTEMFKNYDINDGLQSNEFNAGAYFRDKEGFLLFGGVNGVTAFLPDTLEENTHIPPVVITSIHKFDEVIKVNLFESDEIKLNYKEKYLTFEFSALDYRNPKKNKYAYMMEGFDEAWIQSGTRRFVTYPYLDHGKYTFRIKGSNNDGVWNERGVSVNITITPPFWQAGWFKALAGFFLLGLAVLVHKIRERSVKVHNLKLEVQVKARTSEIANANQQLELHMISRILLEQSRVLRILLVV